MAECFKDVALRVAPVDETAARGMIAETRAAALLQGWRGAAPCDVDALVHTIVAISALAAHAGPRIQSLEINPLRVLPGNQGVVALDAMIVAGAPGHQTNSTVLEHSRSDERRVGQECVSTCRARWWPYHKKKKKQQ